MNAPQPITEPVWKLICAACSMEWNEWGGCPEADWKRGERSTLERMGFAVRDEHIDALYAWVSPGNSRADIPPPLPEVYYHKLGPLDVLQARCHEAALKWWQDPATGLPIVRNKGELIALIHSEISEALEGERKDLMDDHLPHRRMAEVELADALIRIFDYAGGFGYDLQGAFEEKMAYNAKRADHTHEARLAEGGKKF